jgi:hypothetical protein
MQYIRGIHSLKFGADIRQLTFNDLGYATLDGQYTFNGQYTGNPAADFLLGIPNYVYVDQVGPNASVAYQTNNAELSFYVQDEIRVSRSLTVNASAMSTCNGPVRRQLLFPVVLPHEKMLPD